MQTDNIQEARRQLPLPKLMAEMGYGDRAKKSARCPFYDDQHPSFGIFEKDGRWLWKCHACGEGGDEIDFIAKAKGIDIKEATKEFLRMAGVSSEQAKRTESVKGHSASQSVDPPRIVKLEAPAAPVTFEQWRDAIASNFPGLVRPAEVCLSVVAQVLINDVSNPFALALVDVPSSGKTITLNFFDGAKELIYTSDNFTPAAFVSHASNVKREDLDKVDLLPRIRYRTLIIRELGSVFGAKDDDLIKSLGILTRVLDGEGLETDSGVHGKRGYKGDYLFMLLAGTPPIAPRVFKVMGNFGSRLFFLALHTPEESDDDLIAQNLGEDRKSKENACKAITDGYLRTLWAANPAGITWNKVGDPRDCLRVIAKCARLLAHLRGAINVWSIGDDGEKLSHSVPVIEKPNRINTLLYNLARGHAIACGRQQLVPEDLWPVLDLTFDSAPTTRARVFRALIERGTLSTSDVVKLLRCSPPTARKEMEALAVLGVAEKSDGYGKDQAGRPEIEITLDDRFEWFASPECEALMKDEHTPSITTETDSEGDTDTGWKSFQNPISATKADNEALAGVDRIKKEIAPSVTVATDERFEADFQTFLDELNRSGSPVADVEGEREWFRRFREGKTVYPGDWIRLYPDESYPHWRSAREQAANNDCEVCGESLAAEPYLWCHRTRQVTRCPNCQETEWWTDGYEIDEFGQPSCWSHEHSREQRIAERNLAMLEKATKHWKESAEGRALLERARRECERLGVRD